MLTPKDQIGFGVDRKNPFFWAGGAGGIPAAKTTMIYG